MGTGKRMGSWGGGRGKRVMMVVVVVENYSDL